VINAKSLRWHYPDQVMRVELLQLLSAIKGSPFKCSSIKPYWVVLVKSSNSKYDSARSIFACTRAIAGVRRSGLIHIWNCCCQITEKLKYNVGMLKILVVDDEQSVRRSIEKNLTRLGHDVLLAENGEAAWKIIQAEPIRFVITDWEMPLMDGVQLIKKIRATALPGYVYSILITANNKNENIIEGLYAGADDYLIKPLNPTELEARVAVGERMLALEDGLDQVNNQLEKLAMVDSLTGLLNRRAIYRFARGELERARRVSEPISIIFLDIDQFRRINDDYGHLTGDEALRLVAQVIKNRSRTYDSIGRWAGDEFLIVMPGASANDAENAATRIVENVGLMTLPLPDGGFHSLTASAGIASLTKVTGAVTVLDDMLQAATEALFRAKNAGGNQVDITWL